MMNTNYLSHYGVLGMKWGKHKRPESARVIASRKKVQITKDNLKKELDIMNKETKYGMIPASTATQNRVAAAGREARYAKEDLSSSKILDKFKDKTKSSYQLKMEEKYKAKGMTDDEATVAAYQNIRTKKILMAVGTIAVGAAAGYATYKFRDDRVDKIIKSGTKLQHVTADSTMGVRDAFYSSKNVLDKQKYAGIYGQHLKATGGSAFKKEIEVISDIRQASRKSAQNILSEMVRDDKEFSEGIKKVLNSDNRRLGATYFGKMKKAEAILSKGTVDKNVYEVFNAALVDHSPDMQPLIDKFYNKLSEKGYNALKDVNDAKYSGYKALNPLITFNSSGKVKVTDVKELIDKDIAKAGKIAWAHIYGTDIVKQGAITTAGLLGTITGMGAINKSYSQKRVESYRKKNPNTKMTNTEIIRMLERGKKVE